MNCTNNYGNCGNGCGNCCQSGGNGYAAASWGNTCNNTAGCSTCNNCTAGCSTGSNNCNNCCNSCGNNNCCSNGTAGCSTGGCFGDGRLGQGFSCIINLIIILIVLQFLAQLINGLQCGDSSSCCCC